MTDEELDDIAEQTDFHANTRSHVGNKIGSWRGGTRLGKKLSELQRFKMTKPKPITLPKVSK